MAPRTETSSSLIPLMNCILLSVFVFYVIIVTDLGNNVEELFGWCPLPDSISFLGNVRHVNH